MIRFSKYIWLYFCISALVLVPGIYSLIRYGLRPSIDFSGGTLLELKISKRIDEKYIRDSAKELTIDVNSIQRSGDQSYLIRMKPLSDNVLEPLAPRIASASSAQVSVVRKETVGPVLGAELLRKATFAALLAILAILSYVAYAFKNIKFGVAAVVALLHDLLVILGIFSLFGHFLGVEVDTLFVTAFLTTMSFSVHDTIVVFDRIREYLKRNRSASFEDLSDIALTETINRSMTNSFTIIFMLLALVLMGGETIKWFVVALLVGTVSGTYSSPFIATPVLLLWHRLEMRKKSRAKR
jgi:preprotein translocase subunit SecF